MGTNDQGVGLSLVNLHKLVLLKQDPLVKDKAYSRHLQEPDWFS